MLWLNICVTEFERADKQRGLSYGELILTAVWRKEFPER
jgi:hypothetical protein